MGSYFFLIFIYLYIPNHERNLVGSGAYAPWSTVGSNGRAIAPLMLKSSRPSATRTPPLPPPPTRRVPTSTPSLPRGGGTDPPDADAICAAQSDRDGQMMPQERLAVTLLLEVRDAPEGNDDDLMKLTMKVMKANVWVFCLFLCCCVM
jgi:hypothetical protein